jgi:predicted enzyme related to lactoylglutathione lyase
VQLKDAGVNPEGDVVEAAGVGRFAHVLDPAGTRLELWEPADDQ